MIPAMSLFIATILTGFTCSFSALLSSRGFWALRGINQAPDFFIEPGILSCTHNICTRLAVISHFAAASERSYIQTYSAPKIFIRQKTVSIYILFVISNVINEDYTIYRTYVSGSLADRYDKNNRHLLFPGSNLRLPPNLSLFRRTGGRFSSTHRGTVLMCFYSLPSLYKLTAHFLQTITLFPLSINSKPISSPSVLCCKNHK